MKIYFDVKPGSNDDATYKSDVLANIYGIDFALTFDDTAFDLTSVIVGDDLFSDASFTKLAADMGGKVKISQSMGNNPDGKVFRGKNLFATLTFQVATEAAPAQYDFDLDNSFFNVVHPKALETDPAEKEEFGDYNVVTAAAGINIEVLKLGDVNGDGVFTNHDVLKISQLLKDPNAAYNTVMDMDKDGNIALEDLRLLREASVGNAEYLTIIVDPNAPVEAA